MKTWFAAAWIALIFVSQAGAATVTFILSSNFDGSTANPPFYTANAFSLYAFTSAGDNAGLASFSLTLGTSGGSNAITSVTSRSPRALFLDETSENAKYAGFWALRSNDFTGRTTSYTVQASIDLFSGDGVATYGVGQQKGNVSSPVPDGYTYQPRTSNRSQYGELQSGGILNPPFQTYGQIPVLLATGSLDDVYGLSLADLRANVFRNDRSGMADAATIQLVYGPFTTTPEPASLAAIAVALATVLRRSQRT